MTSMDTTGCCESLLLRLDVGLLCVASSDSELWVYTMLGWTGMDTLVWVSVSCNILVMIGLSGKDEVVVVVDTNLADISGAAGVSDGREDRLSVGEGIACPGDNVVAGQGKHFVECFCMRHLTQDTGRELKLNFFLQSLQ